MTKRCPICKETRFKRVAWRLTARCANCGALERGRFMWLAAEALEVFKPGTRVMHLAPEPWLSQHTDIRQRCDYRAFDIDPARYDAVAGKVEPIDLTKDIPAALIGQFDCVVHNHVVEHIPRALDEVFAALISLLSVDGVMLFSVPVRRDSAFAEDIRESATPDSRRERFGRENHYRVFGDRDFEKTLAPLLPGVLLIETWNIVPAKALRDAGIPREAHGRVTSHTPIFYRTGAQADASHAEHAAVTAA